MTIRSQLLLKGPPPFNHTLAKDARNVIDKILEHDLVYSVLIQDFIKMVGDTQASVEGVIDHHGLQTLHGTGSKSHRYTFLKCKQPRRLRCVRIIIRSDCYNFNWASLDLQSTHLTL